MRTAVSYVGGHRVKLHIKNNISTKTITPTEITNEIITPDNIKLYKKKKQKTLNIYFYLFSIFYVFYVFMLDYKLVSRSAALEWLALKLLCGHQP